MAINLNRLIRRKKIAWLGGAPLPDVRRLFEEREYLVTGCTDAELQAPEFLAGLSAAVLTQSPEKPLQITRDIKTHARRLLNHDCLIVLRAAPGGERIITNAIDALKLPTVGLPLGEAQTLRGWQKPEDGEPSLPYAKYFDATIPWRYIANFISENPVGPAPFRPLEITIQDRVDRTGKRETCKLRDDLKLLVMRAFADCSDVHLVPMDDGHSGVAVFRAHAELRGGVEGQWPQTYFVKIGNRQKVFKEYKIYEESVDHYVPFHLGPHLVQDRCCLGATDGIIVGDYVEESESLRECARGRSASAIACLFDRTLVGWHRQARTDDRPFAETLISRFPNKINTKRFARARELGATLNLDRLRALFVRCDSRPVLVGPIHGDLHAANVRVRATDAIVIDFAAHQRDPLVYDAAALEASLLVDGFGDDDRDAQTWLLSVEQLYENPPFDRVTTPAKPKDASFWFYESVQQIRRYARQWECGKSQYAGAVALALLIKATKDPSVPEPEASRRAAAYVLAERVLSTTFRNEVPQPSAVAS